MGNAALYRFMDKVQIMYDGCWQWKGAKSRGGGNKLWYGSFKYENKTIRAHVYSSNEIAKQECGEGFERHHTCDNSLCVNPDHIKIISEIENKALRWADNEYRKDRDPPF